MPKSKSTSKHPRKFRFLLDSAFATISSFPRLNRKANLKHCVYDLGLSREAEDKQIYNIAALDDRFVVTINYKDFKKLVRKNSPGVLAIESGHSNEDIDKILTKFIFGKNPLDYYGKALKVK